MPSSITDCYNSDGEDYAASYMYGGQIQQQQPRYLSPDDNTEANAAMIVDEAEKLFTKVVKDSINKTVQELKSTDATASDSKSSLSLSLLPRKELSDVQKDSTQKLAAAYTYRKGEVGSFAYLIQTRF